MSPSSEVQLELIGNYSNTSAVVLFLYESIVTLPQEIEVIWRRKWTAMTWLYAFTRYTLVVDTVFLFIPTGKIESCKAGIYLDGTLQMIQFICFASFSAFRVYALLDGKYLIAGLVFLLNLVPVATNMFNYIATRIAMDDSGICSSFPAGSNNLHLSLSLATRIAVIMSDALVLAVTWSKTARLYKEARRLGVEAPLASMLFRDGTLYFIILLIINILQVLQFTVPSLFNLGVIEPFFTVFPPIIVCRFILNLRQIKPAGSSSSWVSGNQSVTLRFMGNIGQALQFGRDEEVEDVRADGKADIRAVMTTEPEDVDGAGASVDEPGIDRTCRGVDGSSTTYNEAQCRATTV